MLTFRMLTENSDLLGISYVDYSIELNEGARTVFSEQAIEVISKLGVRQSDFSDGKVVITAPEDIALMRQALEKICPSDLQAIFQKVARLPEPFEEAVKQVHRLNILKDRNTSSDPDFPLGGLTGFPYSWPFNKYIQGRFLSLLSDLEQHGITMQIGAELEFAVSPIPLSGYEKAFLDFREKVDLEELTPLIPSMLSGELNDPETIARIRQLTQFLPRDFLMLHLYEHDDIIKQTFEYKFGTDLGGSGYYDNEHMFELNTPPLDAATFFETYIPAQRHILEKLIEFGFPIQGEVSQQLNMSFWRDGRNILLGETPADSELTQKIIRSLGYTLDTGGHDLIVSAEFVGSQGDYPVISPSRVSLARHAHGRIEMKGFIQNSHHLILGATLGAAAAVTSLTPESYAKVETKSPELQKVTTCATAFPENGYPWLRHAINGSTINVDTGEIIPDVEYLRSSATKILNQINPDDPEFIAIDDEGNELSPVNSSDHHVEAVEVLISKAKLIGGEEGYRIEWPENTGLQISEQTIIDLDLLNEHIQCLGISERFIYPASSSDLSIEQKISSLRDNKVLKIALGESLAAEIVDARLNDIKAQDPGLLFQEFVSGMAKALAESTVEDDGTGYVFLEVPIGKRPKFSAEKGIKSLMKKLRADSKRFNDIFNVISLLGMSFDEEELNAIGYFVRIPAVLHDQMRGYFASLDKWANKPKEVSTGATAQRNDI